MKIGSRLRSTVCSTEVIVVKAPAEEVVVECGGAPMEVLTGSGGGAPAGALQGPGDVPGTLVGKRYGSDDLGLELLCTKAGKGSLTAAGEPLGVRGTKHLPSSD